MSNKLTYKLAMAVLLASLGFSTPSRPRIFNRAGQPELQAEHWYCIRALGEGAVRTIEVYVFGEIGTWGMTSADFIHALKEQDDGVSPVIVYFDTIGGDLFDGIAMHNVLQSLGERCTARVVGACFSAGSVAASGAHRVEMADNALWMIHNPWTWTAGDSDDLRRMADMMDKALDGIVASYMRRPLTIDEAELRRLIAAESYLTPAEAKAMGFVDELLTGSKPLVNNTQRGKILNRLRNLPESYRALLAQDVEPDDPLEPEPEPEPEPELEPEPEPEPPAPPEAMALAAQLFEECRAAGISDHAGVLIKASGLRSEADVQAAVGRAKALKALCTLAKLPGELGALLASGMDEAGAKAALYDKVVAMSGQVEINNSPPLETLESLPAAPALDPGDIYAKRRQQTSKGART